MHLLGHLHNMFGAHPYLVMAKLYMTTQNHLLSQTQLHLRP
jgi:hypothetical protein